MHMAQADLRRVERCRDTIDRARADMHDAIMAAWRSGESYQDIGRAAGMSKQRVGQIVKEAKK